MHAHNNAHGSTVKPMVQPGTCDLATFWFQIPV